MKNKPNQMPPEQAVVLPQNKNQPKVKRDVRKQGLKIKLLLLIWNP